MTNDTTTKLIIDSLYSMDSEQAVNNLAAENNFRTDH